MSNQIDWRGIWSDLLQSTGKALLQHDGSPIAQAALYGIDQFDNAQERRRQSSAKSDQPWADMLRQLLEQLSENESLSDHEAAAYWHAHPDDRSAWTEEYAAARAAELGRDRDPAAVYGGRAGPYPAPAPTPAPPTMVTPRSASPFEGWSLADRLPLTVEGTLNLPGWRR